jgi:multisubunit Na+/H+ antiporter MnhG subunit
VTTVIIDVILFAGVLVLLMCAAGIVVMRNPYERLHYVSAASWGALLVGVSVLLRESFSLIADKALATAFVLVVTGPVLMHSTARAFRIHQRGAWNPAPRRGESEDATGEK